MLLGDLVMMKNLTNRINVGIIVKKLEHEHIIFLEVLFNGKIRKYMQESQLECISWK